tara:strand:+ start:1679 stop:1849 length:171 start_codon:yes stop_codon:yes gene_type:complete
MMNPSNKRIIGNETKVKIFAMAPSIGGTSIIPTYAVAMDKPIMAWDADEPKRFGVI